MSCLLKKITISLTKLIVLTCPLCSFAWWDEPHVLIVEISRARLEENHPDCLKWVKETLVSLDPSDSHVATDDDLLSSGYFADSLTSKGFNCFKTWHGWLISYRSREVTASETEVNRYNKLFLIRNLNTLIHNGINKILDPKSTPWEKSFYLKMLFHAIGDLHQPLHCIQYLRVSPKDPTYFESDLGGYRGCPLDKEKWGARNLHTLWDSLFGEGKISLSKRKDMTIPLSCKEKARRLVEEYPYDLLVNDATISLRKWLQESYEIGKRIYDQFSSDGESFERYFQSNRAVARQRLVLAGYRLADFLSQLYRASLEIPSSSAEE